MIVRTLTIAAACLLVAACASTHQAVVGESHTDEAVPPMYAAWPSAEVEDISQNAYGAFAKTPRAPEIGDTVTAFVAPTTDDKGINLARDVADGPIIAVFYRGFW